MCLCTWWHCLESHRLWAYALTDTQVCLCVCVGQVNDWRLEARITITAFHGCDICKFVLCFFVDCVPWTILVLCVPCVLSAPAVSGITNHVSIWILFPSQSWSLHSALLNKLPRIGKYSTFLCDHCQEEESVEYDIVGCNRSEGESMMEMRKIQKEEKNNQIIKTAEERWEDRWDWIS